MQPSANIDMSVIQEALQRRASGGSTPAMSQMTQPQASLPTGGANVPTQTPQQAPQTTQNVTPGNQGAPVSPEGNVVGKLKQGAQFDDETKVVAKQLLSKLIGVL